MRAFIRNMAHLFRLYLLTTRFLSRCLDMCILANRFWLGRVLLMKELQEHTFVVQGVSYSLTRRHFLVDSLSSGGDLLGEGARKKGRRIGILYMCL